MTILGRVLLAAILLGGAYYASTASRRLEASASAWQALATLSRDVPAQAAPSRLTSWLPAQLRPAESAADRHAVTADYWQSRYDALARARGGDPDPAVMLTASNAAYRLARLDGGEGTAAAEKLDSVIEAYAAVMKADPTSVDAAWNYEFTTRTRDVLARARVIGARRAAASTPGLAPPPPGATIHGVAGAPPPEAKGEEFETIAPMDFGDREAQPEATPGTTLKRKG